MNRKIKTVIFTTLLLLILTFIPSTVKAAEVGTMMSNAINITFGDSYTKSWSRISDHLNCYNKINVTAQGILKMTFSKPYDSTGEYGRLNICVYDEFGNSIWETKTYDSENTASSDYVYYIGLAKGTYYVTVKPGFIVTSGVITTNYNFTFTENKNCEIEPNETIKNSTLLVPNATMLQGYFGNEFGDYGKCDYYKMQLDKNWSYRIILDGYDNLESTTTIIRLYSPDGENKSIKFKGIDSNENRYYEFIAETTGNYYIQLYNYSRKQVPYKIGLSKKKTLLNAKISSIPNQEYTGNPIQPALTIKYGSATLKKGTDYTVTFSNNKRLGKATVKIVGKGNYAGEVTKTFNIVAKNISKLKISNIPNQKYTGYYLYPDVTIKNGNETLSKYGDYLVSYSNNRNIGKAKVIIKGIGDYTGTVTKTFNIIGENISNAKISSIKNQAYTGKAIKPAVTVKYGYETLENGIDYTVSYSNNKNTGKATVKINGKGKYTGTITKYFYIVPKKVSGLKNKSTSTTSATITWTKATGASGYELYKYNTSKKKWEKVTTTSKNSYTIKNLKAGTQYKLKVRAYKTISKKKYYGSYSSTLTLTTKPSSTQITSLTTKSKKATLKWNKVSNASGYEVYMATSKSGKYSKISTITKAKTVSYTKSKLTKNKTYYFKVRAYKTVSGKKVYSSYSSVKSIKVK